MSSKIKIIALYHFTRFENYKYMQKPLQDFCRDRDIMGTIILSEEGLNGTVAGPENAIGDLIELLKADERLEGLEWKTSWADEQPFYRMKVKTKNEIVTIGIDEVDPREVVGEYVDPKEWNDIISDPEVFLVDTRNDYEIELGTFENAKDPDLKTFRAFPEWVDENLDPAKHKKVAMFCTGGIRCEKASSYMLQKGFENVYHLKGGILKYLEEVKKDESMWSGDCFVFDNRVTVDHDLKQGDYTLCPNCRMPVSTEDHHHEHFLEGIHCKRCFHEVTPERLESLKERKRQIDLAKARGDAHIGISTDEKRKIKLAEKQRQLDESRRKEQEKLKVKKQKEKVSS